VDVHRLQRRTVRILVAAQILGGLGVGSGLAVGSLLVEELSGSAMLAGLALTASVLGGALAAVPLARLSTARGRRWGVGLGYAVGAVGGALVVVAADVGNVIVALSGMTLFGVASAANLQARFAATDLAEVEHRARALSTVVWATTLGAVVGPNLAEPAGRSVATLGLPPLGGPFLWSVVAFLTATVVLLAALRPDPLLHARTRRAADEPPDANASLRAALGVIARARLALLGLVTVVTAHTVMVGVMVMTPVHMSHGGAALRVIGLVISGHIAGMYAFSPVFGWLADRVGRVPVVGLSVGIFAVALVVAGTAGDHAAGQLGLGLFLLGLGWSAALVAGSTLITDGVSVPDRAGAQGAADFLMQFAGAAGGALAGVIVGATGYGVLAAAAAVLLVPVVLLALPQWRAARAT
jgi:MFS family permease